MKQYGECVPNSVWNSPVYVERLNISFLWRSPHIRIWLIDASLLLTLSSLSGVT